MEYIPGTDDYLRARTWALATVRAFGSVAARDVWRRAFVQQHAGGTWSPPRLRSVPHTARNGEERPDPL